MAQRHRPERTAVRDRVTPRSAALQRRMELALGALRAVTLVWAAVVCAVDASSGVLDRPGGAFAVLAVLAAWSVVWTVAIGRRDRWVSGPAGIVVDLALACLAVAGDAVLYDGDHPQTFASAWPLIAVVATGIAAGPTIGLAGGAVVGLANLAAVASVAGIEGEWLSSIGTLVLLAAAGWVSGWVAERLRTTAQDAADAQARAEVATALHDGVLQTLAVIQRRSTDDELVALARDQDAELRAYLRGEQPRSNGVRRGGDGDGAIGSGARLDLAERLRAGLADVERRERVTAHVVVVDSATVDDATGTAVVGAAAEAVTNAAKHAGVDEVWVSVDRASPSGTMVVVHDEGAGFDPATVPAGSGITGSIHARLDAVGGTATIRSAPGRGTDVTLWVPGGTRAPAPRAQS